MIGRVVAVWLVVGCAGLPASLFAEEEALREAAPASPYASLFPFGIREQGRPERAIKSGLKRANAVAAAL